MSNKWFMDYMNSHSRLPGFIQRRCSAKHSLLRQSMIRKMKIIHIFRL